MHNEIQLTSEDYMITMLQAQKEEKEKVRNLEFTVKDHDRRIHEIESNVPINASLNNYVTKIRVRRIIEALGGKSSKAYRYEYPEDSGEHYKSIRTKAFAEAERRFSAEFNLRNYGELRQHQYEDAVKYWESYEPSESIIREACVVNNQLSLQGT